jgi:hypothetical protein
MKLSTPLLLGSLAVNAALVAFLVIGPSGDSSSRPPSAVRPATATGSAAATSTPLDPDVWTALQAGDLAAQRDRLRAGGFPPDIIRSILAAQVNESFAARRKALTAAQPEMPFWKNPTPDPKVQAALRDLSREEEKILKDLLGKDARDDDPAYAASLHRQFGDLPDAKIEELRRIQDDYNRQRSDIFANARSGGILPEERQKLTALEKAMHADFGSVLTPEELMNYDLRSSNTASQLRYNLAAFDPSEQEYRTLFQLQQAFDQQFGPMYSQPSQDEMKARSDAQKLLDRDISSALGEARYADYLRAKDYNYRQTSQLVARLELPPETANQVYAVQQDVQQRMRTIQMDRTLQMPDRLQQLSALADEAKAKIAAVLGPRGFDAYPANGGSWLQNVAPRPAITQQMQMTTRPSP